jgi:hypothetical protein
VVFRPIFVDFFCSQPWSLQIKISEPYGKQEQEEYGMFELAAREVSPGNQNSIEACQKEWNNCDWQASSGLKEGTKFLLGILSERLEESFVRRSMTFRVQGDSTNRQMFQISFKSLLLHSVEYYILRRECINVNAGVVFPWLCEYI